MVMKHERPSMCIVGLNAYPMVSGRADLAHIGGAELQLMLVARGLKARGYDVRFVTEDHGQPDGIDCDGIRVFKAYDPADGLPILRLAHPRISGMWRAMKRADADVYYQRMAEETTGVVAAFCRYHGRRFIYSAAHDFHCMKRPPTRTKGYVRAMYRYGLRRADVRIAQTRRQQTMLQREFGLDAMVIPNSYAPRRPLAASAHARPRPSPDRLLWVGRFDPTKRLEMFLDLAAACPDIVCDVVGDGQGDASYTTRMRERMERLPNVRWHGRLPHDKVEDLYSQVSLLVCTSAGEGFPNTFLEAWSRGLAVATTFDPDGIVREHGLGAVVEDVEGLIACVRSLLADEADWADRGPRVQHYVAEHHDPQVTIPQFEEAIQRACARSRG